VVNVRHAEAPLNALSYGRPLNAASCSWTSGPLGLPRWLCGAGRLASDKARSTRVGPSCLMRLRQVELDVPRPALAPF
jgi:hypothetical protein